MATDLPTALLKNSRWVEENLWVALSPQGVELFREQGRQAVINQLVNVFKQPKVKKWYFCTQSNFSDLTIPCSEPIWLDEVRSENEIIYKAKVPLDLCYFQGHFAHFPLVPGVVELQWVVDKITAYFGCEMSIVRMDNLKFQKFLRPNDEFELTLKWDETKNRMGFQLKTDNEMCGSGLVVVQNIAKND